MMSYLMKFWVPLAIAATIIAFTVYAAVQQDIRIGANDPQIQLAQDGATALAAGASPAALVGNAKIDIHASLAPFTIIFDEKGKVLASSGQLGGQVPVLPAGVLEYTRGAIDDRITWQPASTTRIAAIVRYYSGAASSSPSGFIVVGRNLREIESRERQLELMVGAAWVALLALTLIVNFYSFVAERRAEEIMRLLEP